MWRSECEAFGYQAINVKKYERRQIKQICKRTDVESVFKCEVKHAWEHPWIELNLQGAYIRAGQYVGIYRTGTISLKHQSAISKKYNKTDYRVIEISQSNRKYRNIFRVEHLKYMKNLHISARSVTKEPEIGCILGLSCYAIFIGQTKQRSSFPDDCLVYQYLSMLWKI